MIGRILQKPVVMVKNVGQITVQTLQNVLQTIVFILIVIKRIAQILACAVINFIVLRLTIQ